MNLVPWLMWSATIIIGIVNCVIVCKQVEKIGLERLGATGRLFEYMKGEEK